MSAIRRLAFAVALVGLALLLPMHAQARPSCSLGGPICTPSNASVVCASYCQQQGLIWDYCVFQTGCCYCTVE